MRISIRVTARAKSNEVIHEGENRYRVRVTAPPVEGRANEQVIEVLAEYFHKPKRKIVILKGGSARDKIIDIV